MPTARATRATPQASKAVLAIRRISLLRVWPYAWLRIRAGDKSSLRLAIGPDAGVGACRLAAVLSDKPTSGRPEFVLLAKQFPRRLGGRICPRANPPVVLLLRPQRPVYRPSPCRLLLAGSGALVSVVSLVRCKNLSQPCSCSSAFAFLRPRPGCQARCWLRPASRWGCSPFQPVLVIPHCADAPAFVQGCLASSALRPAGAALRGGGLIAMRPSGELAGRLWRHQARRHRRPANSFLLFRAMPSAFRKRTPETKRNATHALAGDLYIAPASRRLEFCAKDCGDAASFSQEKMTQHHLAGASPRACGVLRHFLWFRVVHSCLRATSRKRTISQPFIPDGEPHDTF